MTMDYVFILRENVKAGRLRLYVQYFSTLCSFHELNVLMDGLNDNECLVVHTKETSDQMCEKVFRYKGDDVPLSLPAYAKPCGILGGEYV